MVVGGGSGVADMMAATHRGGVRDAFDGEVEGMFTLPQL